MEPTRRGQQANIFLWGGGLEGYQGCTLAKMYLSRYQWAGVITSKTQASQQFISVRPEELRSRARIRCSLSIYALVYEEVRDSSRKAERLFFLSVAWLEPAFLWNFSLLPHTHNLLLMLSEAAQMSPIFWAFHMACINFYYRVWWETPNTMSNRKFRI